MVHLRFLLIPLLGLLCSGCATVAITPVIKEKPAEPYRRIATLVVDQGAMEFRQLDPASFEQYIQGDLNSLSNIDFRQQLERSLQRHVQAFNTAVIPSHRLFEVNTDVTYEAFADTLHRFETEAILLINLQNYWYTRESSYDAQAGVAWDDDEPNAAYLCYLIDFRTGEPVWMAKVTAAGIWAGYDTLNNHLARKVGNRLRQERYVFGRNLPER